MKKTQNTTQWAEETGISRVTINARLRLGWTVERVFTQPVRPNEYQLEYNGEIHNIAYWSKFSGISKSTLHRRIDNGLSIEEALNLPVKGNK